MTKSTDPLLQPFQLRHLTLRNRILSTAHAPSFAEKGHPRNRYRLYHEEKARGGVGLTMIGGSTNIAPDSPSVFGQLYAGDDSIVPWFKKLTDGVRSYGAGVMCQLTHMGRRTAADDGFWLPVIGPSGRRERAHRSFPKTMENEDINRVIQHFVAAAKRCQRGGFDGIELLSHSHLLGQFLSPLTNRRQDKYGGSLENRLRLSLQVVDAVREAVGTEFILGVRITGDELIEGGLSAEECIQSAQQLAATGCVDFLNVLAGAPYDDLGLASWVAPMGTPSAPHLSIAQRIRQAVSVPIFHAGAISDIATARHAVAEGHVDLIGMTRAQIADPYLVQKLENGMEERIRPCVGLGYCVDRVNQGKAMVCGHNAATGREATQPHVVSKANEARKVVVIGGGPAGLEAARVSAERGHNVVLFEASERLGGQINLASKSCTRRQIAGISDWLINEVIQLGVCIHYNHYAEAADVLIEQADVVLIATGGWSTRLEIRGAELTHTCWDVLSGEVRPRGEVLVYDEVGDHAAGVCSEVLARSGCQVKLISPDRAVAQDLGPTNASVLLRELTTLDIGFECFLEPLAVVKDGSQLRVTLRHVLTGKNSDRVVDSVIVENGSTPIDELYHELKPHSQNLGQLDQQALIQGESPFVTLNSCGKFMLARIGDAVASRNIHTAIYDALRVCQHI